MESPAAAAQPDEPPPLEPAIRWNLIDLLLRDPGELLARFDGEESGRTLGRLAALALAGHAVYGLIVGSFAQGMQWWAAPLKLLAGIALCGAICFPSLYIFVCLSGARARLGHVAGVLLSFLALSAVFLAGFAPVAWIFSQSSSYVTFIAVVHYLIWFVSIFASARLLFLGLRLWRARRTEWAALWLLVLVLTTLQMTTVLRPIVGPSTELLQHERRFFLQHWARTIESDFGGR